LLILYVWAQPTVERRARGAAAGPSAAADPRAGQDAELEAYEPEIEEFEPEPADAARSTLDAKAPVED
jgi:hypothetical protein